MLTDRILKAGIIGSRTRVSALQMNKFKAPVMIAGFNFFDAHCTVLLTFDGLCSAVLAERQCSKYANTKHVS